jgi:hypothetical protein
MEHCNVMPSGNYTFYLSFFSVSSLWSLLFVLLSFIPFDDAYNQCSFDIYIYLYVIGIISSIQTSILIVSFIGTHAYLFFSKNNDENNFNDVVHYNLLGLLWFGILTLILNFGYFVWGSEILANNYCMEYIQNVTISLTVFGGICTLFGIFIGILYIQNLYIKKKQSRQHDVSVEQVMIPVEE